MDELGKEFSGRGEPTEIVRMPGTEDRHSGEVAEPPAQTEAPHEYPFKRNDTVILKSGEGESKEKFTIVDITYMGEHADVSYRYNLRSIGVKPRNITVYPNEIEEERN